MMVVEWDLPAVHHIDLVVPPEAIDALGHVNNTEYLRFLEQAAWRHTRALGIDWSVYQRLNRVMVARHTEIDYLAPAYEGERLRIGTWIVTNDGRLTLVRRYQIIRERDGMTLVRARTRWVCVALDSGRPRRMPPEFREGYRVTACEQE